MRQANAIRIELPHSFLEMPRWWHEGAEWLAALPNNIQKICERWSLKLDGNLMHGSNAIVVPVLRDHEPLALRMTFPDARTSDEIRALRFSDGRGTVRILDADAAIGASLLERLDGAQTLADLPLDEALPIIARLMRRLAVPTDPSTRRGGPESPSDPAASAEPPIPTTSGIVRDRALALALEPDWRRLGQPFDRAILDAALDASGPLGHTTSTLAVNGDLHFGQVLRGEREPWLAAPISSVRQKEQAVIKANWESIGVQVELVQVESAVFFDGSAGNDQNAAHKYWDVDLSANGPTSPIPPSYMNSWYAGPDGENIAQAENDWQRDNTSRWQNAEYEALFEELLRATEVERANEILIALNDLVVANVVAIPLVQRCDAPYALSNRLRQENVAIGPRFAISTWNIANWNVVD